VRAFSFAEVKKVPNQTETLSASTPLTHQINAACGRLGVGRSTLYKMIKAGDIRTVEIAGRVLVPESELQRVLAQALAVAA
jgi:excisionase family DNA binding protein